MIIISFPAFSQSYSLYDLSLNFNTGDVGYGGNFPSNKGYDIESYTSIINIGIEERYSRLGLIFSPVKFFGWAVNDQDKPFEFEAVSFLNLNLYWNIIEFDFAESTNLYLGPFTSINYAFIDDAFLWDRYIFTAGAHMGLRAKFNKLNYNIFTFEMGYRSINGENKYHVGGKLDLAVVFVMLFFMFTSDANAKIDNRYDWQ